MSKKKTVKELNEMGFKKDNYPITWHVNALKLSRYSKRTLCIGICGYASSVYSIAVSGAKGASFDEVLKVYIILDVYVTEKACENARYCLNVDCPMNKVNPANFRKYGCKTIKDIREWHKALDGYAKDLGLKCLSEGSTLIYKKPLGCITRK